MSEFNFLTISIFPEIFQALNYGVTGQALAQGLYQLIKLNPRHYSANARGYIDDKPFGGGPGMVMSAPALDNCLQAGKQLVGKNSAVVHLSPHGFPLTQARTKELLDHKNVIFLCGRYEGIDQRVIDEHATHHICLADVVLSGGELAALACLDAMIRQIPGVLNNPESITQESFQGPLLDHPHYTRPKKYKKYHVPPVLLSGDHARIHAWRKLEAEKITAKFQAMPQNEDKTER